METILKKYRRKARRISRLSELILIALTLSSLANTEHVRSHSHSNPHQKSERQSASTYLLPLTDSTLQLLDNEMQRLFLSGYDWDHSYTQCVIKQILLTRRISYIYDPGLCSRLLRLTKPNIPLEASIELSMKTKPQDMAMIEFTPDSDSDYAREVFVPLSGGTDASDGSDATKAHGYRYKSSKRSDFNDKVMSYLNKLLEDSKHSKNNDQNLPLIETEFTPDLNSIPVYSEGVVEWMPVDSEVDDNARTAAALLQLQPHKSMINYDLQTTDGDSYISNDNSDNDSDSDNDDNSREREPSNNEWSEYVKPLVNDYQSNYWSSLADTDRNEEEDELVDDIINEDSLGSFPRQHRYDTKKPGPGWDTHEPDSSEKQMDYTLQPQAKLEAATSEPINAHLIKPNFVSKADVVSNQLTQASTHRLTNLTLTLCGLILAALVSSAIVFLYKRNAKFRQKLQGFASRPDIEASQDYQDLCRQRMQNKSNEKPEPIQVAPTTGTGVHSTTTSKLVSKLSHQSSGDAQPSSSSRSSTSSWSEEPVSSNMDISTGHMILSYMEDHLKKKDRLEREWEALCAYEADPCSTNAANLQQNVKKNRYPDVLPYDHSRVILNDLANIAGSDYINADTITDHDPRNPAYIATQAPLPHTTADFWQMIWEQGSVIIVMLTRLRENGVAMCQRYWPEEGSEVYHTYEVHLVSEHIWCDDYLVRSFYLKNLKTSETRTVTQFHFLSWPENGIPPNAKTILEFRRKVNKSYRGRSCPIVVHCSDGSGRTGTYTLIDMVLNRMTKGAKEIDIAATLEHIRDQRVGTVKTKAQFEYVLTAVAEEVQAILKALRQN